MTRSDIEYLVSKATGVPCTVISPVLDVFIDALTDAIASGGAVKVNGLGVFEAVKKAPRVGRNVRTGEQVQIPAKVRVEFRSSAKLDKKMETCNGLEQG